MKEQLFYQWLRNGLLGDIVRIESVAGVGLPDVNICWQGMEAWLELKVSNPREVMLRPEQFGWGQRRANVGGSVFVLSKGIDEPVIHIWQYPHIEAKPSGKYARICNPAGWIVDYNHKQIMKVIFPAL